MLVLSRQKNESIVMYVDGGTITVTLIEIGGKRVCLGFDAPDSIKILRSEIIKKDHLGEKNVG